MVISRLAIAVLAMAFQMPLIAAPAMDEPITPIPAVPDADADKVALGESLFRDPRLSRGDTRSCSSCHRLDSNGATAQARDTALSGEPLPVNTLTVFNSALSFRLTWRGDFRTLEAQAEASIRNERTMGGKPDLVVGKLAGDPFIVRRFRKVYGRPPDMAGVLDALATFQRSLVTPGSRFDRWLLGDADALSEREKTGYELFKSHGCIACHQGVNVGGNMFQRPGIFRALTPNAPRLVRVPSLRNVGATAPYFHDGSARTLEDAIGRMGVAQLNTRLPNSDVVLLAAFLRTLTGNYEGQAVSEAP